MNVEVITPDELTTGLRCAWTAIQRQSPALESPYFCPEYVEAAAGCRRGVRIGVVEDGGSVIGLLPFEVGRFGVGGPVGGRLSDFHGLIAAAGTRFDAARLVAGCGLRLWQFDHLVGGHPDFERCVEATAGSPVMDLTGGFDRYCSRLPAAGALEDAARKLARLRRRHCEVRFEFDTRDAVGLDQAIRWKREQCRRTGVEDFLGRREHVDFVRTIADVRTPAFAGVLSVLRVDGRLAAVHFGMRSHNTLHHWFPAYETEFARYSPGLILLVELARAAAGSGITKLDLGKGDHPYKRSFCTHEASVGEGAVAASALFARLRQWRAAGIRFLRTARVAAPLRVPVRALRRRLRATAPIANGGQPR